MCFAHCSDRILCVVVLSSFPCQSTPALEASEEAVKSIISGEVNDFDSLIQSAPLAMDWIKDNLCAKKDIPKVKRRVQLLFSTFFFTVVRPYGCSHNFYACA